MAFKITSILLFFVSLGYVYSENSRHTQDELTEAPASESEPLPYVVYQANRSSVGPSFFPQISFLSIAADQIERVEARGKTVVLIPKKRMDSNVEYYVLEQHGNANSAKVKASEINVEVENLRKEPFNEASLVFQPNKDSWVWPQIDANWKKLFEKRKKN